jgi:hypothetical protein
MKYPLLSTSFSSPCFCVKKIYGLVKIYDVTPDPALFLGNQGDPELIHALHNVSLSCDAKTHRSTWKLVLKYGRKVDVGGGFKKELNEGFSAKMLLTGYDPIHYCILYLIQSLAFIL